MTKRMMIIAGEASGDLHAAEMVQALQQRSNSLELFGIAGPKMRAVGVEALVNTETIAVMGFVEVLANLRAVFHAYDVVKQALTSRRPDLLILVDYPGFNLKIAELAKQQGIKVLYYISPQIWAWRQSRIKKIKQFVDKMAVILPFEEKFYQEQEVSAQYVGSPLVDELDYNLTQAQARHRLEIETTQPIIGLFPGSRKAVIAKLLPVMLAAVKKLQQTKGKLTVILPVANTLTEDDIVPLLDPELSVKLVKNSSQEVIKASDVVLCSSGTATLETALLKVPMLVVYRMNVLSFHIIKRLITISYVSLCNIVAEREVVKELIQNEANADNIAKEVQHLLEDSDYRQAMLKGFEEVREKIGGPGAAAKVADLALSMVQ